MVKHVEKYTTVGGVRTRYIEAGPRDGPAIILIPGGLFSSAGVCQNALAWEFNLGPLSKEFRMLSFDTLGQGRTAFPSDASGFSMDAVVNHAAAFLDAMGVERAHLVGHDEGALIAVRLGFALPERVASCTVVNSPSLAPSGDGMNNLALSCPLQPLYSRQSQRWFLDRQSASPYHIEIGQFLNDAVAVAHADGFSAMRKTLSDRTVANRLAQNVNRLKIDNYARFRTDGFPVPILILWGDEDPLSTLPHDRDWNISTLHRPRAFARSLFDMLSPRQRVTQMRLIPDAGYMPFRERPDVFNAMVGSFVRATHVAAYVPVECTGAA